MWNIYSKLLIDVVFPLLDMARGTTLFKSYRRARVFEYAKREYIENFQRENLRKLLKYCREHVPYYRELLSNLSISQINKFEISELEWLPPLTKDAICLNYQRLQSEQLHKLRYKKHSTGGSTGNPLTFLLDLKSWSNSWANNFRGWGFIGYHIGDRMMVLGSSSLFKQNVRFSEQKLLYILFRMFPFSGINMSDEVCLSYIDKINRLKIKYLYGYASSLYLLAKYVVENNIRVRLAGVVPTSEICPPHYRDLFNRAFHCPVVDSYGARDGNISGYQCASGNYHLSETSIVRIQGNREEGRVLVTDLFNYAMPLINYDLGDTLKLTNDTCPCGRNQYLAKTIIGRQQDILELANGKRITGPGWTILFKDRSVSKYRIRKTGNMSIAIELVPLPGYVKDVEEKVILESLEKNLGKEIKVSIEYYDNLPTLPSGKASYFIV